ncbi:high mobility group box domain-containing protein, partial [Mycena pura]
RPENAFILFRRHCCKDWAKTAGGKQCQRVLSKLISRKWRALSPRERAPWEALAKTKKKEHEAQYPNYVYRP